MYEEGVEIIYVQPHVQPIFIPDDEEEDRNDVACFNDILLLLPSYECMRASLHDLRWRVARRLQMGLRAPPGPVCCGSQGLIRSCNKCFLRFWILGIKYTDRREFHA